MARVKIEEIISYLDGDIQKALEAAVKQVAPQSEIEGGTLFRAFVRAVGRKCSTWERVPDHYVDVS